MHFKMVIWGLGTNGLNLIDILGKENIIAIIESDPYKVEMNQYQNIPIINFLQFLENYKNNYVIVSPLNYIKIEEELKKQHIDKYLIYAKCQASPLLLKSVTCGSFIKDFSIDINKHYVLQGVNLFSIYLYNYMVRNKISVEILGDDEIDNKHIKNLCIDINKRKGDKKEKIYISDRDIVPIDEKNFSYKHLNDYLYKNFRYNVKKLKKCIDGKRIFIIGNGPSLRIDDLELLQQYNEITIGVNRVFHIFNKTNWRPTYYVALDYEIIKEYEEYCIPRNILENCEKIFSDNYIEFWDKNYDEKYYFFRQGQLLNDIKFSKNCEDIIYTVGTVIYSCLQLAVYMGAREIFLLGCDFSYSNDPSTNYHCYDGYYSIYNKEVIKEQKLDYLNTPVAYFPYERAKRGYEKAKECLEKSGIKIINATREGKLEVFERVNFEDLFN